MLADVLPAFVVASVLLALAPGPDNLFVLTHAAVHGALGGLRITFGLCTGLVVHTAAVALGVAALIRSSSWAFTALKLTGAAYLVYLAWKTWAAPNSPPDQGPGPVADRDMALYRRGVIMNLTNPKVLLFFLAFLPQFVSPGPPTATAQVVILGAVFIVCALLVFSSIALLAGSLSRRLRERPGALGLLNRVAAWVFLALALRLLFSST